MKNKLISLLMAALAAAFLLAVFSALKEEQVKAASQQNKIMAIQELNFYSDRIQSIINENINAVDFLEMIVRNDPDISNDTIENYAEMILSQNSIIKNVAVAPNGVVNLIFPLKGNEKALGHNLLGDSERERFAEEAIKTRKAVTQGPVEAKQGGYLIFNRKAIFLDESKLASAGENQLWGFSVVTLDFEEIVKKVDLEPEKGRYLLAFRAKKTDGKNDFLWGTDEIFSQDSIKRAIMVSGQQWELAILPKAGWENQGAEFSHMRNFFYIIVALIAWLIYLFSGHYQKKFQLLKKDQLTDTLNQSAFKKYVQKHIYPQTYPQDRKHAICVMDINNFKEINDNLGHPVGDYVLIELADRIKKTLRTTDRVSRFGGDEYILFLKDIDDERTVKRILKRIEKNTRLPIEASDEKIETSFSQGYAIFPDDGKSYEALYSTADKRMYKQKRNKKQAD